MSFLITRPLIWTTATQWFHRACRGCPTVGSILNVWPVFIGLHLKHSLHRAPYHQPHLKPARGFEAWARGFPMFWWSDSPPFLTPTKTPPLVPHISFSSGRTDVGNPALIGLDWAMLSCGQAHSPRGWTLSVAFELCPAVGCMLEWRTVGLCFIQPHTCCSDLSACPATGPLNASIRYCNLHLTPCHFAWAC